MAHIQLVARRITGQVLDAAIEVHRQLGPGLLESAYENCLAHELALRGISFVRQQPLPVVYKDCKLDCGYRLDLIVEGQVLVEIKAIDALHPIHEAQVLTYLKLSGLPVAFLINFNVLKLKDGVRRLAMTQAPQRSQR
jgi:GxxExxY protein